jgi:hypothetical protein
MVARLKITWQVVIVKVKLIIMVMGLYIRSNQGGVPQVVV